MSSPPRRASVIAGTAAALLLCPHEAFACPVCFGASDSPLASGMNAGIGVLLAVTAGVLATAGVTAWRVARRARRWEDAAAPRIDDVAPVVGERS